MALEEKMMAAAPQAQAPQEEQLSEEEEQDLEIAVLLGKKLVSEAGNEVLSAAQDSSDPSQVIGQFLVQLGSQLAEELPEELKPSPRVFLASGGWLEQMSDFIQDEYDIGRDVMDRAEVYVASTGQQMAQAQQQKGAAPPGAPPAPPMPQGGMQ